MKRVRITLLVALVAATACRSSIPAPAAPGSDNQRLATLSAILWVQTAAEFDALTRQTYRAATSAMRDRLEAAPSSSIVTEATAGCSGCAPAVIIDVDETVLDNSAHDARRILDGQPFEPVVWTAWVNERAAHEIPGALAFAQEAQRLGVTVFYVTNRTQEEEAGTRDNLRALGFPVSTEVDTVLTKGDLSASASSDKSDRRRWVATNYRVLLIIGDDLNDFVPANVSREERDALIERHAANWGTSWFMLPNPVYGSWERALLRDLPDGATPAQRREHLLRKLDTAGE